MSRQRRPANRQPATVFVIKLHSNRPAADNVRSLKWLLKRLLRGHQLRCVDACEERSAP
jgi:hypothetical protein